MMIEIEKMSLTHLLFKNFVIILLINVNLLFNNYGEI
jgi:hypothetical protein